MRSKCFLLHQRRCCCDDYAAAIDSRGRKERAKNGRLARETRVPQRPPMSKLLETEYGRNPKRTRLSRARSKIFCFEDIVSSKTKVFKEDDFAPRTHFFLLL